MPPYLISSAEPQTPEYVVGHSTSPYFEFYTADFVRIPEWESIFSALPSAPNWCDYLGRYIAFSGGSYVIVFDLYTLQSTTVYSGVNYGCAFSPNNLYLSRGGAVYNVGTWTLVATVSITYPIFTYDSTKLLGGNPSGQPRYYPVDTWVLTSYGGAVGKRDKPHVRSAGDYFAMGKSSTPYIEVYNIPGFTLQTSPATLPVSEVTCPQFSPDGATLAAGGASYLITYTFPGMVISTPGTQPAGTVSCMLFPDNQSMILLTNDANSALLYSTSTWTATNLTSIKNGSCISKRK